MEKKFINKTSREFYEFSNDPDNIPLNVRVYSQKIYEDIIAEYPDLKKWLTRRRLKIWIDLFAIHKGYKTNHNRDSIGIYFELITNEKPTITHGENDF